MGLLLRLPAVGPLALLAGNVSMVALLRLDSSWSAVQLE